MDHFKVTIHGRLYTSRGKTHPDMMYFGGCIFVDHATGFIHIEHMINFTATETIQTKRRFEKKLLDMGVLVQSYQSDNGIFTSSDFMEEINKGLQNITFIGVGTHHQNRIAERGIQSILTKEHFSSMQPFDGQMPPTKVYGPWLWIMHFTIIPTCHNQL